MTEYQRQIPDYLGGICTIPTTSRNPNEVTDAENCLFSEARGCYKRPGTKRIVSDLETWIGKESIIEVFPVGRDVLQVVTIQDGKAQVFWVNVDENEVKEFVEFYSDQLTEGNSELEVAKKELEAANDPSPEREEAQKKIREASEKLAEANRKLKQRGFYHKKKGNNYSLVDPQNLNPELTSPIIETKNPYLTITPRKTIKIVENGMVVDKDIPDQTPEKSFRITKDQGRVFILNRDKEVKLTSEEFPDNDKFGNHWLLYFVALTSGRDVSVTVKWNDGSRKLDLGQVGIETVGEDFLRAWNGLEDKPNGFQVIAKEQVVSVRLLSNDISDLKFEFENVAVVVVSEEDGIRAVPSFEALPNFAPEGMIIQVSGSAVTKLDDTWLQYENLGGTN